MIRPTEVEARDGYRIWLRYSDGTAGEIDLSHLAGRGVFKAWSERAFFETVHVSEAGAIAWGEDLDFCPDALYMQLTGKSRRRGAAGCADVERRCLNSSDSTESSSVCTSITMHRLILWT